MLGPADISEIEDGLWRWTAGHPDWTGGARRGSTADWPREVGSVVYSTAGTLLVIDPLVPEGADALWGWLDERAAEHSGRVAALNTTKWHRRSRDAVAERYAASTSRARGSLPDGVEPVPIRGFGETMFWLERPRALVPGDRLLGGKPGELRLCPSSWLGYLGPGRGRHELAQALRPLLDLPVERVLVSHGAPVLRHGRAAIAKALEEAT